MRYAPFGRKNPFNNLRRHVSLNGKRSFSAWAKVRRPRD